MNNMPLFSLRLYTSAYADAENLEKVLLTLRKYPSAFDEIWLASLTIHASAEKHRICAESARAAAEKIREIGNFRISMQISETFGHGEITPDEGNFKPEESDLAVDSNNVRSVSCCCPQSERFLRHTLDACTKYAAILRPESCYIDDDLRLNNHGSLRFGCFCPRCLELFSRRQKRNWTFDKIIAALSKGEPSVRTDWIDFNQKQIAKFAGEMAGIFHDFSPETVMGIQNAVFHEEYNGLDFSETFRALKKFSGHPARVRAGAGAYSDRASAEIPLKALMLGNTVANARVSGCIDHVCSEVENYPVTALSKSPRTTAAEALLGIAFGCDGASVQIGQLFLMREKRHEKYFEEFEHIRNFAGRLSVLNRRCRNDGFRLFRGKNDPANRVEKRSPGEWSWMQYPPFWEFQNMFLSGIPVFWNDFEESSAPVLITDGAASGMDASDVAEAIKRGALLSGSAFLILEKRNLLPDTGIFSVPGKTAPMAEFNDTFLTPGRATEKTPVAMFPGTPTAFDLSGNPHAVSLCDYTDSLKKLPGDITKNGFSACWYLDLGEKGRLAVLGTNEFFTGDMNPVHTETLFHLMDALGKSPRAIRTENCEKIALIPASDIRSGKTAVVTVVNTGCSTVEGITLFVRRPESPNPVWIREDGTEKQLCCAYVKFSPEEEMRITLPPLSPWECGGLFFS